MADPSWDVTDTELVYDNEYFGVEKAEVELPSGDPNTYYRLVFEGESVICLAVDDGAVIFLELYRPRLQEPTLELPGGGIEDGESPTDAARREFREETGLRAGNARHLGSTYFSAWTKSKRHFVWLEDLAPVSDPAQSDPEIEHVTRVPVSNAFDQACTNPIGEWNLTAITLAQREGLIRPM